MRGSHGRDDAASIPIFAMSANAFVEDRQAAKEAGMDVHIAKPIDAELLKKKIAEYRKRSNSWILKKLCDLMEWANEKIKE